MSYNCSEFYEDVTAAMRQAGLAVPSDIAPGPDGGLTGEDAGAAIAAIEGIGMLTGVVRAALPVIERAGAHEVAAACVEALRQADGPHGPTQDDIGRVQAALWHLRAARDLLAAAEAPRALERVRGAIKSAEGAERNAGYRLSRAGRKARAPSQMAGRR